MTLSSSVWTGYSFKEEIPLVFAAQQKNSRAVRSPTADTRSSLLLGLRDVIPTALYKDTTHPLDTVGSFETTGGLGSIDRALENLDEWMATALVTGSKVAASGYARYEVRCVLLLFAAGNFPLTQLFEPQVLIIAAGSTVFVKTYETSPTSGRLVAAILRKVFAENEVAAYGGKVDLAALVELPFNRIFLTGCPKVSRTAIAAAAKHFASVTLELGGKSPLMVDKAPDFGDPVQQLAVGKTFNLGQACTSSDQVMVPISRHDEFVDRPSAFRSQMLYVDCVDQPEQTSRVVNESNSQRLQGRLSDVPARSAKVAFGDGTEAAKLIIKPTIFLDAPFDADVMQKAPCFPLLATTMPRRSLPRCRQALNRWPCSSSRPMKRSSSA